MSTRYLCSHLVEIHVAGTQRPPSIANLERIEAEIAVAAVEQPLPLQAQALLQAAGFAAPPPSSDASAGRPTRGGAGVRDGFQWSPGSDA